MQELITGARAVCAYLIPAAAVMLSARKIIKIPDELFRKLLHFILLGLYIPFVFVFKTWWIAVSFAIVLIVIIYPILMFAGKIPAFSSFVNERKKGEFKSSMVLAIGMIALSITICWGIFNDKYLVLACVYAWGIGDAFAALVGKRFGKHKIRWQYADPHKSVEGSLTMFTLSVFSVYTVLMLRGELTVLACVLIALIAAAVCTVFELCTNNGLDTVTCPAAAMLVMIPLVRILGG